MNFQLATNKKIMSLSELDFSKLRNKCKIFHGASKHQDKLFRIYTELPVYHKIAECDKWQRGLSLGFRRSSCGLIGLQTL